MKNMPRITEIIKIEPYKITCRWSTGEILVMDFEQEFFQWETSGQTKLLALKEYNHFRNVGIKDGTLQWQSVQVTFNDLNGEQQTQSLDLDPDVIYRQSQPITHYWLVKNPKRSGQ